MLSESRIAPQVFYSLERLMEVDSVFLVRGIRELHNLGVPIASKERHGLTVYVEDENRTRTAKTAPAVYVYVGGYGVTCGSSPVPRLQ